ncbi:hypothetical protein MJL81_28135, partial [Salmonella enterica subsp. enterica serovar Anatum]|nr:hypothetical protein [Salmonella enterica subsp. enterica serovar Anatum]
DTLKAFGITLDSKKSKKGKRYNVNLSDGAQEWLGEDELSAVPGTSTGCQLISVLDVCALRQSVHHYCHW